MKLQFTKREKDELEAIGLMVNVLSAIDTWIRELDNPETRGWCMCWFSFKTKKGSGVEANKKYIALRDIIKGGDSGVNYDWFN